MSVDFRDNRIQVKAALNEATIAGLYTAAGEIEARVKRNTRVDTGQTKNSWQYEVDESAGEATIGNPLENAIWEEFGTGEYALGGNGRKGGWSYKDQKGKWHHTTGKKPTRAFHKAFTEGKAIVQRIINEAIKEGMG